MEVRSDAGEDGTPEPTEVSKSCATPQPTGGAGEEQEGPAEASGVSSRSEADGGAVEVRQETAAEATARPRRQRRPPARLDW